MKKSNISASTIVALGAGAVALAASTYYFFGPEGKIHRKKAAGWMIKMKGEIIEKLEDAGDVTEKVYHDIVDSVLASYMTTGKITAPELHSFADDLKKQWKQILKTAQAGGKETKKKTGSSKKKRP